MQGNTNHGRLPKPTDGVRLRHAFVVGTVSIAALASAGTAQAAVQQVSAAQAGIPLEAEEAGGTIVVPAAGVTVQGDVVPDGCDESFNDTTKDCRVGFEVTGDSSGPAATQVVKGNGSDKVTVREQQQGAVANQDGLSALTGSEVVAASTPSIYHFLSRTDKLCSVTCSLPHPWEARLTTDAYAASDGFAWGDINRWGRVAEHPRTGATSLGYSVSFSNTGFRHDPSCLQLYANTEPNVAAAFKGFPISKTYYMHRHYTECAADGHTHQRRTWFVWDKA